MKNLFYITAIGGMIALMIYAIPEGIRKQAIVDCYKAKEICTRYWDVHQGDCFECKHVEYCEKNNLFD